MLQAYGTGGGNENPMLFFETHLQFVTFWFSVLAGLMLGMGLDRRMCCSVWQFAVDLAVILLAACWLCTAACFFRADAIGGYQLLGCIVGIGLYSNGIGRVKSVLGRGQKRKEGFIEDDAEI